MKEHPPEASDGDADWPYSSLLMFGFFGTDSPGGKRLVWHSLAGLALIVLPLLLQPVVQQPGPSVVLAIALPAGVAWIGLAAARYLGSLDELSRTIQLKAYAASYGAVLMVIAAMLGIALALPAGAAGSLNALLFVVPLAAAELFRGLALVFFARKYR